MINYTADPSDFTRTYSNIAKNSLQFENICETLDISSKVRIWECELITRFLPSIIESASAFTFTSKASAKEIEYNPQKLSTLITGVSDYWYLILAMNGYKSRFEFKNFGAFLFVPNVNYIKKLLIQLENDNLAVKL